jgi:NAD(P)-dependent dehydrogenase (short-subunit alcohol dehydrogenase family)
MLNSRLAGKVAIVTGAAGGIGRETALVFAREGAKVQIVDMNEAEGKKTLEMVTDLYGKDSAIFTQVNVSKNDEVKNMVEVAEKTFGKVNIMFNNAGIMHSDDDNAMTTDEKVWDLTLNVNMKGVFLGCKYGIPALLRAGGGSIINTASFVAILGAATPQIAYTASKGGVLAMSRELAVIHARQNIRVNSLCPGPLRTELLMKFLNTEEKKQRRLVHVPIGRFGEAKEMANAVLFLASDESSYVTGSSFMVDGGALSLIVLLSLFFSFSNPNLSTVAIYFYRNYCCLRDSFVKSFSLVSSKC